jgi:hypothetical protein
MQELHSFLVQRISELLQKHIFTRADKWKGKDVAPSARARISSSTSLRKASSTGPKIPDSVIPQFFSLPPSYASVVSSWGKVRVRETFPVPLISCPAHLRHRLYALNMPSQKHRRTAALSQLGPRINTLIINDAVVLEVSSGKLPRQRHRAHHR